MICFSVEGTCGKPGGRGEGGVQKGGEGSGKIFGRNVLRVGSGRGMQTFVNHWSLIIKVDILVAEELDAVSRIFSALCFILLPTPPPSHLSLYHVYYCQETKTIQDHNLVDFKFSVNDNLANLFKLDRRWLILLLLFCLTDGCSRSASCSTVLHWRKEEKNKISNRTTAACSCQGMYLYHHVW